MTYFWPQRSTDSSHNGSRGLCYHTAMIITKRFRTKYCCKILRVSPFFKVLNSTYWPLKSIFLKKRSMLSFHTLRHSCKHSCEWHYQKLTLLRKFFLFCICPKILLTFWHLVICICKQTYEHAGAEIKAHPRTYTLFIH